MELDFSKLDDITGTDPDSVEMEEPEEGYEALFARVKTEREAHKRTTRAYRQYQDNIKKSETLQTEILKGLHDGEDLATLFLKACEAISRMTGNTAFYSQIEKDMENR